MTRKDNVTATTNEIEPATRMGAFDEHDQNLIRYLGLNPNSPADRAAVAVCKHYGFDPLLKHVVVIPKSGVYVTRDGLLNVAHRSGQLDGIVVEQDPVQDESGDWVAKVSVYRKDMSHPFTYPGRYPADGSNRQYAQEMALKAAEAHALRRAFEISGLPTVDEQRPATEPQKSRAADLLGHESKKVTEAARAKDARRKLSDTMFAILGEVGLTGEDKREDRLIVTGALAQRPISSSNDLTDDELGWIITKLKHWQDEDTLAMWVNDILHEHALAQQRSGRR
jgi:hypothetical protein